MVFIQTCIPRLVLTTAVFLRNSWPRCLLKASIPSKSMTHRLPLILPHTTAMLGFSVLNHLSCSSGVGSLVWYSFHSTIAFLLRGMIGMWLIPWMA